MGGTPPIDGARDGQPYPANLGELKRVGEEVLQYLLQALGVCVNAPPKLWIDPHLEREVPIVSFEAERTSYRFKKTAEHNVLGVHRHCPRFDLREIKDVADQIEEIAAGPVNRPGKLNLLG